MTLKKYLESIRGWLPKTPNLPKELNLAVSEKKKSRIFLARTPSGLKLVVVLFWVFGLAGILMVAEQFLQFGYLPFNLWFLMAAVTVADSVGMFIVGAGLLTAKRRWIDIAIVFSIASIAVFYLVPLRPAFPLEILAISYLVYMHKGFPSKQLTQKLPVALAVLLFITILTPVVSVRAELINTGKTEVMHYNQSSDKGNFVANLTVYQYADMNNEKDYYYLEVDLQCSQRNLNYVNANLSLSPPEAMLITFTTKPHVSPASPLAVGFGASTVYIGNPETIFVYTSQTSIDWIETTINPKQGEVFSVELWVPQGAHFMVNLKAVAGLEDKIFGNLWMDKLNTEDLEI